VLAQANRGPAAARNRGIAAARAPWTLFLGDDILAARTLVQEHLAWHAEDPSEELAVLGFVTWDPALRITPLMRWLEESGSQFAYRSMQHGGPVPPGALYTSNLSFSTCFLRRHRGFDESFPRAAWEDSELHFRLARHGLRTRYHAEAVAHHHHPTRLADFLRRSFVTGYESGRARALHPEAIRTAPLSEAKLRALRRKAPLVHGLAVFANAVPRSPAADRLFWWLLDYHYGRGALAWDREAEAALGVDRPG